MMSVMSRRYVNHSKSTKWLGIVLITVISSK